MNADMFALGLLTVLLIASNVFWARMVYAMTNRLMSRNYFEFVQSEKLKVQKPGAAIAEAQEMRIDPQDERQAAELNSLLNLA